MEPILLVNFNDVANRRIIRVLEDHGMECSEEQADELRRAMHPASVYDDEDLLNALMDHVRVDWDKADRSQEEVLRGLDAAWERAKDDEHARKIVERQMLLVTQGMDEHPEWWQHECLCHECCSYG